MLDTHITDYAQGHIDWEQLMRQSVQTTQDHDKSQGAVYTPTWVVDTMIAQSHITPDDTIWEPSCGHGAFVIPILETVCAGWTADDTLDWLNTHLFASDIDPKAIATLGSILAAWFVRTHGHSVQQESLTSLVVADGLTWTPPTTPTLIIGNPPYVRFQNLPQQTRDFLASTYQSCAKGNVDIYYAFMERGAQLAARTSFIVPNAFLTTQSGKALRALIAPFVDHIHDFGERKIFPGVGTYTAMVFLTTTQPGGLITTGPDFTTPLPGTPFVIEHTRPTPVRDVSGPIATLCDKAFVVKKLTENGTTVYRNALTGMEVEEGIVKPLLKLSTLHRAPTLDNWSQYIIHPYQNGTVLDETYLKATYPKAYAHLLAVRDKLENRDKGKGKDKYPAWFAYGRGQGLTPLTGPELLVVPGMITDTLRPYCIDVSGFGPKGVIIVSGFAVENPSEEDKRALLGETFLSLAKTHISPKPGKDQNYYPVGSWLVKGAPAS